MNQSLTGSEFGAASTTTSEDWMRAFGGLVPTGAGELDAATATGCRSLTTISVSDLHQLDSYPGPVSCDPRGLEIPADSERQRLSGLPLKHRYKQTNRNQTAATSCRRH